jgi:hypothetical protein
MAQFVRDAISGELTLEYFAKRLAEGWKITTVEWVREQPAEKTQPMGLLGDQVTPPFGLRVSENGFVEENPVEATVLLLILEQIVRERRIQEIATELNSQGYATREGFPWTATAVFNLLPRVIEVGPALLKSAAWQDRRPGLLT